MNKNNKLESFLAAMMTKRKYRTSSSVALEDGAFGLPSFEEVNEEPEQVEMTQVQHPDGRMSQYPPSDKWDRWVEWDGKSWPNRVAREYTLVPTTCFNCESGCGLLA